MMTEEAKTWNKIFRKKKARRLAAYLFHLQHVDGVNEIVESCKEEIIAVTTQQFFEDKNWPNSKTIIPPKDFQEDE